MPQPLPKEIKNLALHAGNAVKERPLLSLFAARVIAAWAQLELTMAMAFTAMLQGDPTPAAAIYNSIRNSNAQRDAFNALAEVTLKDQEDKDILSGLLRKYAGAAKGRDSIAHHVWATIVEIPDAILLVNPKSAAVAHLLFQGAAATDTFSNDKAGEIIQALRDSVRVWKEQDFNDVYDRITRTTVMASAFMIMLPNPQRAARDEKARQQLLSDPEIGEYVRRCAQNRKKSP